MTLERGASWGAEGGLPADSPHARSDAELRALVERARRAGEAPPIVGLLGGDLCATLGGRGDEERLADPAAPRLPVDVVRAELPTGTHWFVAHLVAASRTWARCTLGMNAEWRGRWDVAPAAHPGDGRLDLVEADLPLGQRLEARRRVRTGTHVPHPDITIRRVEAARLVWDRPRRILLDGVAVGTAREVTLTVEPGALTVVV